MKIKCLHGYFIFEEQRAGEVSDFISITGLEIEQKDQHFVFYDLVDAPDFSIQGKDYLDLPATTNYEGEPWEIFEANGFVYDYDKGLIVAIASVTNLVTLYAAGNFYVAEGLIKPGSLNQAGQKVKSYTAWFSTDTMKFKYSEVSYV